MRARKLRFLFFVFSATCYAQSFQNFVDKINSLPDSLRQAVADSFVAAQKSIPIVEQDTIAHFVLRGSASTVSMAGDVNDWEPGVSNMIRISGTNFWYITQTYESDARLEYKFVTNGSNWLLDLLNPNQIMEGLGPNSELRMPSFVPPVEIQYFSGIPHGHPVDTVWYSSNLLNSRKIEIYIPASYQTSADSLPVIYFHDGVESITLGYYENIIDYLIANKMIRPIIAVFVPYVNRTPEYAGNQVDAYMKFFVNELIPYIDSTYRTVRTPAGRAVAGASYGGNISLWLGYTYPNVFGNIAAQSSYVDPILSSGFQNGNKLNLLLYMDRGSYDIPSLVPMVDSMVQILQSKGYVYQYHEYHEGHAWGNWRAHIKNALELFFPPQASGVKKSDKGPEGFQLFQNYPNPFNPTTAISYQLASPSTSRSGLSALSNVTLEVFDVLGRKIETLVNERQDAGSHSVTLNASNLPSGIYFCELDAGSATQLKKMVLIK